MPRFPAADLQDARIIARPGGPARPRSSISAPLGPVEGVPSCRRADIPKAWRASQGGRAPRPSGRFGRARHIPLAHQLEDRFSKKIFRLRGVLTILLKLRETSSSCFRSTTGVGCSRNFTVFNSAFSNWEPICCAAFISKSESPSATKFVTCVGGNFRCTSKKASTFHMSTERGCNGSYWSRAEMMGMLLRMEVSCGAHRCALYSTQPVIAFVMMNTCPKPCAASSILRT
mmetsp:Transcript_7903/g.16029  ORF Transcript_7903/g.16029 Transcript_7903/m.16029 type:complete len:230 (-) Transcript_7903:463-1152(-)